MPSSIAAISAAKRAIALPVTAYWGIPSDSIRPENALPFRLDDCHGEAQGRLATLTADTQVDAATLFAQQTRRIWRS
jgi:hypothetical protein